MCIRDSMATEAANNANGLNRFIRRLASLGRKGWETDMQMDALGASCTRSQGNSSGTHTNHLSPTTSSLNPTQTPVIHQHSPRQQPHQISSVMQQGM